MASHKRRQVARAAAANGKRYHLACPSAHRCPQPSCVSFSQHKTPSLIEFKNIICRHRQERLCSLGQFLNRCVDPPSNRLSGEIKDALNSAHAAALQAAPQHRLLVGFPRGGLWLENSIGATVLAMVLPISTTIGSLFDDICTFTDTADVRHGFLKRPIVPHHLPSNHYPLTKLIRVLNTPQGQLRRTKIRFPSSDHTGLGVRDACGNDFVTKV